jgi:hypothetical protein
MDNGSAFEYASNNENVDRLRILDEVASGMHHCALALCRVCILALLGIEYLHRNQVIHGDLRGVNASSSPGYMVAANFFKGQCLDFTQRYCPAV